MATFQDNVLWYFVVCWLEEIIQFCKIAWIRLTPRCPRGLHTFLNNGVKHVYRKSNQVKFVKIWRNYFLKCFRFCPNQVLWLFWRAFLQTFHLDNLKLCIESSNKNVYLSICPMLAHLGDTKKELTSWVSLLS